MRSLQAISRCLSLRGINHVVVAGAVADVHGREQFSNTRIKLNARGQASPNWLRFLKRFGIKSVPLVLDAINGGIFKYQYSTPNKSILIWTQERPDQNEMRPGYAGTVVVRVDEVSDYKYGAVRSALVAISNIQPTRKRMTKEELMMLAQQLAHQSTKTVPDSVLEDKDPNHDSALDDLSGQKFNSLEELGTTYQTKRGTR